MRIEAAPTPEEAAAIVAALEVLREESREEPVSQPNRWELSGRLDRVLPVGMKLEGSPWSYADWEGKG
ncbi:MAG: hypothetical protein ACR2GU_11400 [Rubrobacteraceae bacterium]